VGAGETSSHSAPPAINHFNGTATFIRLTLYIAHMEVYYLRLEDRAIPNLDPALHLQWTDIRPLFEARVEKGEEPFFLLAEGNSKTFSCPDVIFDGNSKEIHIYVPSAKRWAILPITPSILFKDAIKRGSPIKIFLTTFAKGREGGWKLAVLVARQKYPPIYAMKNQKFNLGLTSFDNPAFGSNVELTAALKEDIMGTLANRKKRPYRKIVDAASLPLPTTIPPE